MNWVIEHIVQIVVAVAVLVSFVRGLLQARDAKTKHRDETVESDEQRRTREIQERIRRKIAERRGERPPVEEDGEVFHRNEPAEPVRPSREATQPLGGPLGDFLEQLQRKVQPPPEPPRLPQVNRAELERQAQLEDRLRAAEELKLQTARRAAHVAEEQAIVRNSKEARRAVARTALLADLQDPQSLRRAFVLREVLGTPVGLR